MKISVSNLSFLGPHFESMRNLPPEMGIEIFLEFGTDYYWDKSLPKVMAGRTGGLSMHGPFRDVNLAADCDEKPLLEYFKWSFERYKKYNGEFLVIHTNAAVGAEEKDRAGMKQRSKERIAKLAGIAKDNGIVLAVENMGYGAQGGLLFDCEEFIGIFDEIRDIRCLIDVGHAFIEKWDTEALVKRLAGRIVAFHLHDSQGELDEHLKIGAGKFDWPRFFKACRHFAPDATMVLEYNHAEIVDIIAGAAVIKTMFA